MGEGAPPSPIKQRGLYSEFLGDVSAGLREEVTHGPAADRYASKNSGVSESWSSKIQGLGSAAPTEETVLDVKLTRTDEPKLQVPYNTQPGQPPRQVLLEREKRFYADQDIAALLREEGVDFSHGGDPGGEQYATFMDLPLELFDNTEFDCRNPEEWAALGAAETRGVPGTTLWAKDGDEVGSIWVGCRMMEYDADSQTYLVANAETGAQKWVPRLNLCFAGENPFDFARRVADAFGRRHEAEEVLRYNLFIDCMPTEDVPPLDQGQLSRMLANALTTKELKTQDGNASDVAPLLHEVNLDYMRAQSKFVLDAAVSSATAAADAESTEPGMVDSVFTSVVIPASELPTKKEAPEMGCIVFDNEGFLDKVSDFTFASFLTQPKVVTMLVKIRSQCNWLLSTSPLNKSIFRSVKLKEWEQQQSQATSALSTELSDKWGPNIKTIIINHLKDVGKGWFNIHEQSRDIYEFSKLKRLLRMINFMMEDSLRFMLESTVLDFTAFIDQAAGGEVRTLWFDCSDS